MLKVYIKSWFKMLPNYGETKHYRMEKGFTSYTFTIFHCKVQLKFFTVCLLKEIASVITIAMFNKIMLFALVLENFFYLC